MVLFMKPLTDHGYCENGEVIVCLHYVPSYRVHYFTLYALAFR